MSRPPALSNRQRWFQSQWLEVDRALRDGATLAQRRDRPWWDQWVLAGRQRELRAARSVLGWLAGGIPDPSINLDPTNLDPTNLDPTNRGGSGWDPEDDTASSASVLNSPLGRSATRPINRPPTQPANSAANQAAGGANPSANAPPNRPIGSGAIDSSRNPPPPPEDPASGSTPTALDLTLWRSTLFDDAVARLTVDRLVNLTGSPLEIEILHPDRRRELLALVLRRVERGLEEVRRDRLRGDRLLAQQEALLQTWWVQLLDDFLGDWLTERSTLRSGSGALRLQRDRLLQDWSIVATDILNRAVELGPLLEHLLWGLPLTVDGVTVEAGTGAALDRASALLHNLVLCLACAVVQPVLNRYGDREGLKLALFDRRWLPTREVERFRNDLAWKYRVQRWVSEPKAIYESRYWLLTASDRGIVALPVYAPRNQEWRALSGVPLGVTLLIEARDAIAPRVRATVTLAGRGALMVLQAIGRGLGFIGRGIIQGLGDALDRRKT
ncbi:DUF3685 domain-containing protein [Limnothrix sp. PR1529]|uniref:DUF3685 domain-containing protein n=1 Tax=Limnothrix sp. PR1529 TaxID=1704291 RepID=UPI00081F1CB7|nr:DUF3685 domain-containing protein [Limnothrix sp. PR1529]OCQ99307.1 hypothetical protein BCR12_02445 [Limnothrix sp. P13C2]